MAAAGGDAGGFRVGVDMGGTFVDCVLQRDGRVVAVGKAPAGNDPVDGIRAAVESTARSLRRDLRDVLARTSEIVIGTTHGLNALLTRTEAETVGLITTRGHEDAILIGRVHQKVAGLSPHEVIRVSELRRPEPIVPRWLIHGIHERVAADGTVLVKLDETGVATAADALVAAGCSAIAICFLWSFREPGHEQRAAAIVRERAPGLRVCLSSEIAPVLGEYERVATTVVNAYLMNIVGPHLARISETLEKEGFLGQVSVMTSAGGTVPLSQVVARPVETLRSGPAGGVIAAQGLLAEIGAASCLSADMGGTSFDVGLVTENGSWTTDVSVVAQLHLAVPAIEVQSIGAGGGSVAWIDDGGRLHVGPRAAAPGVGPACFGRGGKEATVTDADVVLGRLDPSAILGGGIALSLAAARAAIAHVAGALGVDVTEAAAGIVRVADAQMADLLRQMSIERGHDPRQLSLVCFGGAGPLHVGAFAPDLGVRDAIIPADAGVFSADGLVRAGFRRVYRRSVLTSAPLEVAALRDAMASMEAEARADLLTSGRPGDPVLLRSLDLRYRRQTHAVEVHLDGAVDEASLAEVVERFERRYEEIHGPGTGYRPAGIEATGVRLYATLDALAADSTQPTEPRAVRAPLAAARRRDVYLDRWCRDVPVHPGDGLVAGTTLDGPALVEWPTTTLLIHPRQQATILPGGHARLAFLSAT